MSMKRPLTAADLERIHVVDDARLSSDGERYAFVQKSIQSNTNSYYSNIYTQYLTDDVPVQWTFGSYTNVSPRWSPDGSSLAFVSDRSGLNQIWIMSTSGGEPKQITFVKHGASNPVWSPDSQKLLFETEQAPEEDIFTTEGDSPNNSPSAVKIDRLRYKSDSRGFHHGRRAHIGLFRFDLEESSLLTNGSYDHHTPDWSPDSQFIVFSANRNSDEDISPVQDLYTLNIETKEISKLTDSAGTFTNASWSPDGSWIACTGHELEYKSATINQIWLINPLTKERKGMTLKWDVQIGDYMIGDIRTGHTSDKPVWSSDQEHIYFLASENGKVGLYQMDMHNEITAVHDEDNHVFSFSFHPKNEQFVLGISDPSNPGDFYSRRLEDKRRVRLTDVNASFLKEIDLSLPETFSVRTGDHWDVQGWIMYPVDYEEGQSFPLILEIHGGPHAMYGHTFFHEFQLLAAEGYGVLFSNPRGSHGYGQAFADACRRDYGGKDFEDLLAILDHAVESYEFVDRNRLGVTGGSYGGFMTNWMISHTDRFKAAVTQRSISNWLSFYGVSDIGFFFTDWEIGVPLHQDPEKLWHHSPLRYVKDIHTPLLIMHSENDYRCPIEQAEQMFINMKYLNKTVSFLRFPGANHELSRSGPPALRIERLNHMVDWFHHYIEK